MPAKSRKGPKQNSRMLSYLMHHLQMFIASLGFLSRQPFSTLMTSAVIAIALALPAGLYIGLDNASHLSAGWDGTTQISLFLKDKVSLKQAEKLAKKLRLDIEIEKVSIIDRDQGLKQFMQISGFGDAIKFLDENPLPHVITVQPLVDQQRPDQVIHLVDALQEEPLVELAQLDMQWVKRLYTLLDVAQRGVWIIGSLLGLAVLLIVGNTIRLDIQNRREAIEVSKLIGASNAFIRRPFLYTGHVVRAQRWAAGLDADCSLAGHHGRPDTETGRALSQQLRNQRFLKRKHYRIDRNQLPPRPRRLLAGRGQAFE